VVEEGALSPAAAYNEVARCGALLVVAGVRFKPVDRGAAGSFAIWLAVSEWVRADEPPMAAVGVAWSAGAGLAAVAGCAS
jgi:hypothetical protein